MSESKILLSDTIPLLSDTIPVGWQSKNLLSDTIPRLSDTISVVWQSKNLLSDTIPLLWQTSPRLIYRRWTTREKLVAAALDGVRDDVAARVPDTGSLRDDLVALLVPVGRLLSSSKGQALVRASLSETMGPELSALSAHHIRRPARGTVRGLSDRARARGELGPAVNVQQLLCALHGALIYRAMFERATITRRWLETLVDLLMDGARPPA